MKGTNYIPVRDNLQLKNKSKNKKAKEKVRKNYQCHKCKRNYRNKGSFSRHTRFECGMERRFVCDYCGHRSKRKGHLYVHIVKVHLQRDNYGDNPDHRQFQLKRTYKCDRCGRNYSDEYNLNRHKRYVCGVDPKYFCDYCDYKTNLKNNLFTHIVKLHLISKR